MMLKEKYIQEYPWQQLIDQFHLAETLPFFIAVLPASNAKSAVD